MAEKEIKDKEPRAKKAEKEGEGLIKELASKRADAEKLRAQVQGAGWDEDKERDLLAKQSSHSQQASALMDVSLPSVNIC
jgi:structural maintenance of chromosome 2